MDGKSSVVAASEQHGSGLKTFNSHPGVLRVVAGGDGFTSKLVAVRAFNKGQTVAKIDGTTVGAKRFSSVQLSESLHVELNSDLVFMNHSCAPSVILDVEKMEVIACRDLAADDEITFFYPSTEWLMDQPFACWCGSPHCVKQVSGAFHLTIEQLAPHYINAHIRRLILASVSNTELAQ